MARLGRHGTAKYVPGSRMGGLLTERWSHSQGDLGEVEVRDTEIIVLLKGQLHVRRRGDGRLQHCGAVPGTIWLCPNGVREDMIHLLGQALESIHLFLPTLPLSRTALLELDVNPDAVGLHCDGGFKDPLIEQVAWAIHAEMTDPSPTAKMLVEILTGALGAHVLRHHSSLESASISLPRVRGAPDRRRLRRVTDFMEAHLGDDLTVELLANEVFLSPFHFASACGFSSRSRFTRCFKQLFGTAPSEYRRGFGAVPDQVASPRKALWASDTMELTAERHGDVLIVCVSGKIDATTASAFLKAVRNTTKQTGRILVSWSLPSLCAAWHCEPGRRELG